MRDVRVALIGFGNVGRGFCKLLAAKQEALASSYGLRVRLVAVSDIQAGSVYAEEGLDVAALLRLAAKGDRLETYPGGEMGLDSLQTIERPSDIVVETTWTNLDTGEPGLTHIREALKSGKDVVTTNKGPIALAYGELMELADQEGRQLRFKGTVMSGTPSFDVPLEAMPGSVVESIEGVLNGTCNYILTRMAAGSTYEEALREAQALGYAEADPTADVEGWDATAKAVILGNVLMGGELRVREVPRRGIVGLGPDDLEEARSRGKVLKLLARVWREKGEVRASVGPAEIPVENPLAHVAGSLNGITFRTDTLGDVTVIGAGAGGLETGQAVMSDLIRIALSRRP